MKTISILLSLFFSSLAFANPCHQRQGALDIGSGSTKAFAAVVDICEKRVLETLFDEKIAVPFKEAVETSGTKEIPAPFIKEASAKISDLLDRMKDKKLDGISAVATSV
ncbi:MAG: Ppx/GppA phosphatase family protein, partial [Pseudobdellovibrionaceae bacterium]